MPKKPDRIPSLREALGLFVRVMVILRPVWGSLLKISAIGIVVSLIALAMPLFSKILIDSVYPARDLNLLAAVLLGMTVLQLASAGISTWQGLVSSVLTSRVHLQADLMFFNHLQHLPVSFFDQHRVGEVTSRFADVRTSVGAGLRLLDTIILRTLHYGLVPPILIMLNPKLCLLALAPVPITTAISFVSGRFVRKLTKQSTEIGADANAYRIEVLGRIRTLKSLAIEPNILDSYKSQLLEAQRLSVRSRTIGAASGMTNSLVRAGGHVALSWVGWAAVLNNELTLGGYLAFMAYVGYITRPVNQILASAGWLQQLAVSLSRAFDYLDLAPEQTPAAYADAARHPFGQLSGRLEVRGVSFAYSEKRSVLSGVELEVVSGERIAIVGTNGSGKSTLLRLIATIDQASQGQILFDGRDVRALGLRDVRQQIMFVWQEPGLVRGTIRENLLLGVAPQRAALIDEACRHCGLSDFIAGLSSGIDTTLAECGASVSGGQRQRMALARAFLAARPLLLLDEATSNVDARDEQQILQVLFEQASCRTAVFVTHRMSSALLADRIVCLEAGRVAGIGTHDELLAICQAYQVLASSAGFATAGVIPLEIRPTVQGHRHERATTV